MIPRGAALGRLLALGACLACLLLGTALPARADTALSLWKKFDGRVNFTGTQVSLRTKSNTENACAVTSSTTIRQAALALPVGATVLSAQLYWAGSGTTDSTVTFEGNPVTATRKYTSSTIGGGFNYFGGAADVTSVVKAKGSGTYHFSGLTISIGSPWCASQGVLGGFSLLVVYAHPGEPERVLNLYEGFRYVQNGEVVVSASNFRWNRTAWPVRERARVGHITWEGDPTLAADGESLEFEGEQLSDALNPEGNQFNSRSNINNDASSYGIDFDAYDTTVLIWSWRDARVTTRYRTGQDLVLLNAEILVVPTLPVSDLSVSIGLGSMLQVGRNAVYNVAVTNNGPYTEAGPVTLTATLPAGLNYVSASGTGWTCSAAAQVVTCTYKGAFAPEANAAPLALTVAVKSAGQKTTTVAVKGTDDDNAANNTATHTATAEVVFVPEPPTPAPNLTSYVFTDGPCTAGVAIGEPGQCRHYGAPAVGGNKAVIYLTATTGGVPAAASTSTTMTPSMQFALSCVEPQAGTTGATYAGQAIPACAASGQPDWSEPVAVAFATNTVSVRQEFGYNDVGRVTLSLKESGATASTREFVVAPLRLAFEPIRHGTVENPGHTTPSGDGFVPAGTVLTVGIGALLADGKTFAPNFRARDTSGVVLDSAAIPGAGTGRLVEDDPSTRTEAGGIVSVRASWSEVGAVNFVARLAKVADTDQHGRYLGVEVPGGTAPVGRFYPAYFTTTVTGRFDCPQRLPQGVACPRDEDGAVYSRQPFDVTVQAFNANNEPVRNFIGDWFRPITLTAVDAVGGAPLVRPLSASQIKAAGTGPDPIRGSATYALEVPFIDSAPRANNWSVPLPVYVRASATERLAAGEALVTSLRPKDLEVSDEGGVLVLNGRVVVPNALGSDLLDTPLRLRAEYWAGAADGWLLNRNYAGTGVVSVDDAATGARGTVQFAGCRGTLALGATTACNTVVVGVTNQASVTLAAGSTVGGRAGHLWLRRPGKRAGGAAHAGSVSLRYDGWPWLPSTIGRVSFGSHRSPVIYVREMYF